MNKHTTSQAECIGADALKRLTPCLEHGQHLNLARILMRVPLALDSSLQRHYRPWKDISML